MNAMLTLVLVVFLAVFAVVALLMFASEAGAIQRAKKTLTNLESALASSAREPHDQTVDIRKTETLMSAVPWINRWLLDMELVPKLRILLQQANLRWTAGRLLLTAASSFVIPGYLVRLRTGSVFLGLVAGSLCGFAPIWYVLQRRRRRFDKFDQGLPEALDLIVGGLRAGHSLVAALRLVAQESPEPISGEFRIFFDEQNYGLDLRTAIENLVNRVPLQQLQIAATAILIQKESGGNLAEVLNQTAQTIRDRFRLKRQIRVYTAQGRLTGWILCLLPLVLGVGLYLVSPDTTRVLWTDPIGVKLLYASTGMTILGGFIIRKIVNMEV